MVRLARSTSVSCTDCKILLIFSIIALEGYLSPGIINDNGSIARDRRPSEKFLCFFFNFFFLILIFDSS